MQEFEKLGVFYLGKEYDIDQKLRTDNLVLYDSKDLVTHAVCVGMTGSGKTGLCIGLIEEAAIDGIPSIVIDPKGDLTNLLLTFPNLRPQDFRPWINEDDARTKGVSPDEYAQKQADLWKNGLAAWGEDGARIQRLKDAADFAIYTPGSNAGIPVSILKSFAAPPAQVRADAELMRDRISGTVSSVLGLVGLDVNPLQSREHILLSTIFDTAWKQGQDLDLAGIIQSIQTPPVTRIGAFDVESFYPSKDRFTLAMMINNLLAAPGFDVWMQGESLDPAAFLYTSSGKPRVCVFSIAHLNDNERMFFVSLLLSQVLSWMRAQSGTTSLRALLYMDEIFGYFPPVANPPSKQLLLTLLKQARAFGLGVVLATQNPVDLDYKGLSNAGTWLIGRLQTERDKERLLDGLEGVSGGATMQFDRQKMDRVLSALSSRVFLMNNVHEDHPVLFESRWALSYLRGPLTREQIKMLMDVQKGSTIPPASSAVTAPSPVSPAAEASAVAMRPALAPEIPQFFVAARAGETVYRPMLAGFGKIYYADGKVGVAQEQAICCSTSIPDIASAIDWQSGKEMDWNVADLEKMPEPDIPFEALPDTAGKIKNYDTWARSYSDFLFKTKQLDLLKSPSTNQLSKPGEPERDFRIRLSETTRTQRDQQVERIRQKYAAKIAALQDRKRRALAAKQLQDEQAKQAKMQTAISFGTTVLGAIFGRKTLSASTLGRATTAARGVGRSMKEATDVDRAQENVEALDQQLNALQAQVTDECDALVSTMDPQTEPLVPVALKPKKTNISVSLLALVWVPSGGKSS